MTWVRRVLVGLGAGFVALQLVPYGWEHDNPAVTDDAPWPSSESASLARAACYDCHSNETDWPVYSYVAPMSWLVRHDVERGRDELNFSTWGDDPDVDDAVESIVDRSMPPRQYTVLHPDARLSSDDRALLVEALTSLPRGDGDCEDGSSGRGRGRGRSGEG